MEQKDALMRYFADEDKNYDTEEVVGFLAQVGAVC